MNRNSELFSTNPTNLDISRSSFNRNSSVKFTFNAGQLIPFYVDEVLPGDTFSIKTAKVIRAQTLLTPMMDNLFLDTYYFYVPNRLVWEHWRECMGANYEDAWTPSVEYSVPQTIAPQNGWNTGTIADYMGIPTQVDGFSVSSLPFRAYCMIYNEWFRDETLADPVYCPLGDGETNGSNGDTINDFVAGGSPLPVFKYHDYFTSALPSPQRGPDVLIPADLNTPSVFGFPVASLPVEQPYTNFEAPVSYGLFSSVYEDWPVFSGQLDLRVTPVGGGTTANLDGVSLGSAGYGQNVVPKNLYALKGDDFGIYSTINQLRLAFGLQRLYEKDARSGGGRYTEIIKAHFGVTSPDARQQRPEYLGGNRLPINVNQVIQQSESSLTPQGTTTGMSLTSDSHGDFSKSFTEHGLVIGVCCVRYNHTYQQGLERMWSRKSRFDFYWPGLANIGEQAILNKEIFVSGISATDNEVFGYQEAWADYRYKPNRVAGEMRSNADLSLDVWHLADDYESLPYLSAEWKQESKSNVDRVLAVTSEVSNQFFADFYIQNKTTRPMPLYSIPGLIDHH